MTKTELREMMRCIVAEEISKQLPRIAEKFLAESFLKKIVAETVSRAIGGRRLAEESGDAKGVDEDEIPEILDNDDDSIYQESPLVHKADESKSLVSRLMRNNPLAHLYEGTRPISNDVTQQLSSGRPDIPLEAVTSDASRFGEIFKRTQQAGKKPTASADMDMKMLELELRRKALDRPA